MSRGRSDSEVCRRASTYLRVSRTNRIDDERVGGDDWRPSSRSPPGRRRSRLSRSSDPPGQVLDHGRDEARAPRQVHHGEAREQHLAVGTVLGGMSPSDRCHRHRDVGTASQRDHPAAATTRQSTGATARPTVAAGATRWRGFRRPGVPLDDPLLPSAVPPELPGQTPAARSRAGRSTRSTGRTPATMPSSRMRWLSS